jgi:hypothetical protein
MELIQIRDLLMNRVKFEDLSEEFQDNSKLIVARVNLFFKDYQWPLKKRVNDGFRRPQDAPKNGAAQSNHYKALAVDLDDDDAGTVWKYVFENRHKLKEIGLWMEHPCWTHCDGMSWLHFQAVPPKSGNRFYVPSTRSNPNPSFWDGKYESELNGF